MSRIQPSDADRISKRARDLGVTSQDVKSIESARRSESFRNKITWILIGTASAVGAFFAGAGVSMALGTDTHYPFALAPLAVGLRRNSRGRILTVTLISAFAALVGYVTMVVDWQSHTFGAAPDYAVFSRRMSE